MNRATIAIWRGRAAAAVMGLAMTFGMISGGALALCGIGGGILLYALLCAERRTLVMPPRLVLGFGLGFLALVMLANIAPLAPDRSWRMTLNLVTIVLPLMLLLTPGAMAWPREFFRYLPWGMIGAALLLIAELASGGQILMPILHRKNDSLVYYNRGISYVAVLVWPLLSLMWHDRRRVLAGVLFAVLAAAILLSPSRGASLALAAGATMIAAAAAPRAAAMFGGGLLAAAALLPLAAVWVCGNRPAWLFHLPPSWRHRAEIWDYLSAFIARSPFAAQGVDAAGMIPPQGPHQAIYMTAVEPAAHPHHFALQLWLELGPLGWLLGVGLAGFCFVRLLRCETGRAAGLASWAAFLVLGCGSFSLGSDSVLAVLALALFWSSAAQKDGLLRENDPPRTFSFEEPGRPN